MGCLRWRGRRHICSIPEIHQDFTRRCPRARESFLPPWYAPFRLSMVRFGRNSCTGTLDTVGTLPTLQGAEAGELESSYLTTYGTIVRWNGALGVRQFLKTEHPSPPPIGVLTSNALDRKTVYGSPTPRPFSISSTPMTYGRNPPPVASSSLLC